MNKIKYRKIELKISNKVFRDLKTLLIARGLADNTEGITDQVLIKIIRYITDNKKEVQIEYKKEREK
tara:strand:+ start:1112 stop:1312 length:201 start_codon:yes stop_codon:yes gene_type:complete